MVWKYDTGFNDLFVTMQQHYSLVHTYLLLTEFEGRTVSYGPSFFLLDLWPKREARRPKIKGEKTRIRNLQ